MDKAEKIARDVHELILQGKPPKTAIAIALVKNRKEVAPLVESEEPNPGEEIKSEDEIRERVASSSVSDDQMAAILARKASRTFRQ